MVKNPPRRDCSIQYGWMPLDFPYYSSIELAPARSLRVDEHSIGKCNGKNAVKSPGKILTTPVLVSAAGGFWKAVSCPLNPSHFGARARGPRAFQIEGSVGYCGGVPAAGKNSSFLVDSDFYLHDGKSVGCFSSASKSDYEHLKAVKGMILFQASTGCLSRFLDGHRDCNELHKRAAPKLMAAAAANRGVDHPPATVSEKIRFGPCSEDVPSSVEDHCETWPEHHSLGKTKNNSNLVECGDLGFDDPRGGDDGEIGRSLAHCGDFTKGNRESIVQRSHASPFMKGGAFLAPQVTSPLETINVSSCPDFGLSSDCRTGFPTSICCTGKEHQLSPDSCQMVLKSSEESYLMEKDEQDKDKNVCNSHSCDVKYPVIVQGLMWDKIAESFAKGKHALAGGLAGISVSICLHPIDTVKSIVQAHGKNQEPLLHTIKKITFERGVMGLYRGIPTNIASSAPISAVYTFTYESVKGAFLPLLPKEYHSVAHCGAGGCASIATSFIFTPSERIKQQMQIHSCYRNSWNALIGVVQKGGLPSLYAGWGAVLCRNVPHSIIKFYTYERLKQLLHPSTEPNAHLTTLPTLVCGGLAGSTAALFTTPFDVVKTRLQGQMPGSQGEYRGVLHLLKEISRREGIRGLYRGLTPRLFMYVSQGAIFFGSYEFLKGLFLFEGGDHTGRR